MGVPVEKIGELTIAILGTSQLKTLLLYNDFYQPFTKIYLDMHSRQEGLSMDGILSVNLRKL